MGRAMRLVLRLLISRIILKPGQVLPQIRQV
jgi:hypothetical protein